MPYVQFSDLPADLPPAFITQALDDDNTGNADMDLWATIAQQVSDAIDAKIGVRYSVPIQPDGNGNYPAVIAHAARTLAAEKLFARRQIADGKNPWAKQADAVRAQLDLIAEGKLPLNPTLQRQDPSASVVTEPIRSVPRGGGATVI
jgi:phage gp36-like protein